MCSHACLVFFLFHAVPELSSARPYYGSRDGLKHCTSKGKHIFKHLPPWGSQLARHVLTYLGEQTVRTPGMFEDQCDQHTSGYQCHSAFAFDILVPPTALMLRRSVFYSGRNVHKAYSLCYIARRVTQVKYCLSLT